jgi:glycogen synthase kinase 3 beta
MNPNYSEFKFPQIKPTNMTKLFTRQKAPAEAVSLISGILKYDPDQRLKPMEALAHKFFDELRQESTRLPSGQPMPDLFNFCKSEITAAGPDTMKKLVPKWYRGSKSVLV